jgi:hypothetical protein
MPGSEAAEDLADSAPTAKTLRARAVFFDPQLGHGTACSEAMDFTSFSKSVLQDLHMYS